MNKQIRVILSISLITCLALCGLLFQILVNGCWWWECVPQRAFKVLVLDIPRNFFPSDAIVNSLHALSEGEGTRENAAKTVYWNQGSGIAIYKVLRYPTIRQASKVFLDEAGFFADPITGVSWEKPSELTFTSVKASEIYIACGNRTEYRCGMVARYEEYVVHFNAVIDSEMTYQNFEDIVTFIDKQISEHLYP